MKKRPILCEMANIKSTSMPNLPSASSCPSISNRNLFRGFGVDPRSRLLLQERSPLLTIWLIFWNRLVSCKKRRNQKKKKSEEIRRTPNLVKSDLKWNIPQKIPRLIPASYKCKENPKDITQNGCVQLSFLFRQQSLQFGAQTHRERGVMMPGDIRGLFMGEM